MNLDLQFKYRGARAMILLHERHMQEFLATWREFRAAGAALPQTDDPDYASALAVLRHILRAGRGYMTWICDKLQLPDPQIDAVPEDDRIEAEADAYLKHLLLRWRTPLVEVPPERFEDRTYTSRWGMEYCIDAMLEHAVMHPIRHTFQLREILSRRP